MVEDSAAQWLPMTSAPKDGSRIIVVIRASEQGPADVDIVRWGRSIRAGDSRWMSTESTHDCEIVYDDWEVARWMSLPSSVAPVRTPTLARGLPAIPDDVEGGGSGI